MDSPIISSEDDFLELCEHIRSQGLVGFDTEFVSDRTYRPVLGLLQFATRERSAAVDPLEIRDLTPWWQIMADDETTVIVHGGQAEIRFCLHRLGQAPQRLCDIQIAEGFRGRSYPLSHSAIVRRVLNEKVDGSQTRTDWTRRPLTSEQIHYAIEDVDHLLRIWDVQSAWLKKRGRLEWAQAEFQRMIDEICSDDQTAPWERLSGVHKLNRRELAALQHLSEWREREAELQDRPARRVMRDDLLFDLARRRPKSGQQALATRDLNRREYRKHMDDIIAVIQKSVSIPDEELPEKPRSRREEASSEEQVIAKLLTLALSNRCAELDIAYTLVASNRDLLDLVRYHRLGEDRRRPPVILEGWRGEMFGDLLKDVMDGKVAFRVAPSGSAAPLVFE